MKADLCLGLMSGTSMDGIDAALLRTNGETFVESVASAFYPYEADVQRALKSAEKTVKENHGDLSGLEPLIETSTALHLNAALALLRTQELSPKDITWVGYHGQTFYHVPLQKITLQIGNAQALANNLQVPVVSQFRLHDVAEGGQGAPLVPIYHWALAQHDGLIPLGVLNCGGIANVTLISNNDPANMLAFDLGPGNVLLDRLVREKTHHKQFFDQDGRFALAGKVQEKVFKLLMEKGIIHGFLDKAPPKSLDSYDCILLPEVQALSIEDGCATLAAFSAECMANQSVRFIPSPPTRWVLAGGGWHNPAILSEFKQRLEKHLQHTPEIVTAKQIGWQQDALEAEAFAYLAKRVSLGLPISFPGTTGVSKPLTGGKIFEPF